VKHIHRIFLLSPANLAGVRAGYLLREKATSELACRLREGGVPLGELFTFLSSLYFRGKLAYARAFSAAPSGLSGSYVITATAGLLEPTTIVSHEQVCEMAAGKIEADDRRYRHSFDLSCQLLSQKVPDSCAIVLLGSIATPKYVAPLLEIFGERLLFPVEFVGRGDMSRGGLMLRAAQAGTELEYAPVLDSRRNGARPPKLTPLVRTNRSENSRLTGGLKTRMTQRTHRNAGRPNPNKDDG